MKLSNAWIVFLVSLLLLVSLHWLLLGYAHEFGGQQSDDDYHYYSFAARLDAAHPFDLPAYRQEVSPDRVTDVYDQARINISFSNFWPYPGWSGALHLLTSVFHLSYQFAAFVLYIVQAALFLYGAQLLMATLNNSWSWQLLGGAVVMGFVGIQGIPSPLFSIPMNMVAALSLSALGLLVTGREKWAVVLLLLAVVCHVAAIALVIFVLALWVLNKMLTLPRPAWSRVLQEASIMAGVVIAVWAVLYYGLLGAGSADVGSAAQLQFDLHRLSYLVRGHGWFFSILIGAGVIMCVLASRCTNINWQLPSACYGVLAVAAGIFVCIGTKYVGHPTLHPVGRLLYLAPLVSVILTVALCAALLQAHGVSLGTRVVSLVCGLVLLGVIAWQGYLVWGVQFVHRQEVSLGPLYARLVPFSTDPALSRTGFIFYNHDYGTVLSAAHLYHGRYFWAKVYSPDQLEKATRSSDRLIYLEGGDHPIIRVAGYCTTSEETVLLGLRPVPTGHSVRMVHASRC